MPLRELEPGRFKADFNQRPFQIRHDLVDHPAFSLERLVELARKLPAEQVEYNAGDLPLTQDPTKTPRTGLSVEETIQRINEAKSWMVLKRVEVDATYKQALDDCLDLIEPLAPGMRTRRAFIFISSPGSVTPYHIDHEYNFLLQIRGSKKMTIFDPAVLGEEAIERFYRGEHRNLVFDQSLAARSQTFELKPGDGVHVPVNAPHYVLNGPAASVSFSITFRTPEGDRRSAVYEVNDRLRRFGLKPRPVGTSQLVDRAKYLGYALIERAQKRLGKS
ncbi:MAG: cupin-like domain-containing protein [Deltaproteobacteria bacterium]|nr:cupin-like domain-containing protein [Deltaproteobacteria bacterium]